MIKIFKKRIYDFLLFIFTVICLIYLSSVFFYEYFDNSNIKDFFKIPSFLKHQKADKKSKVIPKQEDLNEVFEVWTLRLNKYSKDNFSDAKKEYKKLLDSGYRVYLKLIDNNYVLFLGPELDKKKLEQYSKELFQKYKLDATIEEYNVNVNKNDTFVVL